MKLRKVMCLALGSLFMIAAGPGLAKDTVQVAFIGPLTGGVSAIGVGGRRFCRIWRSRIEECRSQGQIPL